MRPVPVFQIFSIFSMILAAAGLAAGPDTPKVDLVQPLDPDPVTGAPGVFFHEGLEEISDLHDSFQDVGNDQGRFRIVSSESFRGGRSIEQEYIPLTEYGEGEDPGNAGWAWRMFGDNTGFQSGIPEDQQHQYPVAVARWYHKFEEGFQPRNGWHFPPKMARMRSFYGSAWNTLYTILFWIGGEDGHISIERHTKAPDAHREWPPNFTTNFLFSDPVNVGRWIHFELRVAIGDTTRSDRVQAWADGTLICDVAGDDIAAGFEYAMLNGMSWDCYWNGGSPARQSRFYDDMMLSTARIGPARTPLNPVIVKTRFADPDGGDTQAGWEAEVARSSQRQPVRDKVIDRVVISFRPEEFDRETVWRGSLSGSALEMTVDTVNGEFTGSLAGAAALEPNTLYFVRVRQQDSGGEWSEWSTWHSGFATTWAAGTPDEQKTLPAGYLGEAETSVLAPDNTPPELEESLLPRDAADTTGPYRVKVGLREENFLGCYVYHRAAGSGADFEYERFTETGEGLWEAGIPGYPAGTTVEYYVRAVDGFENESRLPASGYYTFDVLDPGRLDFNGDGRLNIFDVVSLVIAGLSRPDDPALDIDGDGSYSLTDPLALLRAIAGSGPNV